LWDFGGRCNDPPIGLAWDSGLEKAWRLPGHHRFEKFVETLLDFAIHVGLFALRDEI